MTLAGFEEGQSTPWIIRTIPAVLWLFFGSSFPMTTLYKHRQAIYGHAISRLTLDHADDLSSIPID
jgi:hypothetical protein